MGPFIETDAVGFVFCFLLRRRGGGRGMNKTLQSTLFFNFSGEKEENVETASKFLEKTTWMRTCSTGSPAHDTEVV